MKAGLVLVAAACVAALECPEDIGFAINSGDQQHQLERVKTILGPGGWVGDSEYPSAIAHLDSTDGFPSPIVVYSSTQRQIVPVGTGDATIPITPCCGGVDYSQNIADAQLMREHTFPLMLKHMPASTQWFVSTEDDVWWDVHGLCRVITETVAALGAKDGEPVMMGGGATNQDIIYGPYVIMNRPLLSLFANATLFQTCRTELMQPGNNIFQVYVYDGAPYNLDHLISYCVYTCFPRLTGLKIHSNVKQTWPMKTGKRPEYFYHNGAVWTLSVRAECFLDDLETRHPDERVVAFHHATVEDMAIMQRYAARSAAGESIASVLGVPAADLRARCHARALRLGAKTVSLAT